MVQARFKAVLDVKAVSRFVGRKDSQFEAHAVVCGDVLFRGRKQNLAHALAAHVLGDHEVVDKPALWRLDPTSVVSLAEYDHA